MIHYTTNRLDLASHVAETLKPLNDRRLEHNMNDHLQITRDDFLKTCGVWATGALLGRRLSAMERTDGDASGPLYLKSWERIEFPDSISTDHTCSRPIGPESTTLAEVESPG
jgi:hypothetical protein